jgi:proline iminopeptidase
LTRRRAIPEDTLRYLRRTGAGGAIEYAAQFLDGLIHRELLRSGATRDEERRPLPGDELVPHPMWAATRAVTIDAPPAEVWPWVAQMGYGRGGWYGWNPLEREDTGVFRLLGDLPPPRIGDIWLDGPGCHESKGAFKVEAVEPPSTLVLHSIRDPLTGRELEPAKHARLFIDTAWAFHLDQLTRDKTRLLARTRIRIGPRCAILALKWMGSGDTVMQRRLLDGIKARVETSREPSPRSSSLPSRP